MEEETPEQKAEQKARWNCLILKANAFAQKVKTAYEEGRLKLDLKGHHNNPSTGEIGEFFLDTLFDGYTYLTWADIEDRNPQGLFDMLEKPLDEPMQFFGGRNECPNCGKLLTVQMDGRTVTCYETTYTPNGTWFGKPTHHFTTCEWSHGQSQKHRIQVPSGKLFWANDLREFFTDDEVFGKGNRYNSEFSISHKAGMYAWADAYAKVGIATGYVGNCALQIMKNRNDFIIGVIWDESFNDILSEVNFQGKNYRTVCEISTSLWWFMCADAEMLRARNESLYKEFLSRDKYDNGGKIINVSPGEYEVTNYYDKPIVPGEQWERLYSTLKRVEKA